MLQILIAIFIADQILGKPRIALNSHEFLADLKNHWSLKYMRFLDRHGCIFF